MRPWVQSPLTQKKEKKEKERKKEGRKEKGRKKKGRRKEERRKEGGREGKNSVRTNINLNITKSKTITELFSTSVELCYLTRKTKDKLILKIMSLGTDPSMELYNGCI
jgi:hypothetical protein